MVNSNLEQIWDVTPTPTMNVAIIHVSAYLNGKPIFISANQLRIYNSTFTALESMHTFTPSSSIYFKFAYEIGSKLTLVFGQTNNYLYYATFDLATNMITDATQLMYIGGTGTVSADVNDPVKYNNRIYWKSGGNYGPILSIDSSNPSASAVTNHVTSFYGTTLAVWDGIAFAQNTNDNTVRVYNMTSTTWTLLYTLGAQVSGYNNTYEGGMYFNMDKDEVYVLNSSGVLYCYVISTVTSKYTIVTGHARSAAQAHFRAGGKYMRVLFQSSAESRVRLVAITETITLK